MLNKFATIDLFCGVGGLTHGFIQENLKVTAGIDFDISCKYSFEKNNKVKFISKDLTELTSEELLSLYPKGSRKILVGCAPCQPFSIFNKKNKGHLSQENDQRWRLLYSFSSLILKIMPEIISMENVPLLKSFNNGKVFNDFVSSLELAGYNLDYKVINSQDYGVPQRRKRLVLLGSLLGPIKLIEPTHNTKNYVTVKEKIGKLPPISAGSICTKDPLHRSRKLKELGIKRIKATPEGGSWKDWDNSLKLECHKKRGGLLFGSVYGRMSWNSVSPTITTYCVGLNNGRFGHPDQNRAISLREAALLQSFPPNYDFIDPNVNFSMGKIARQIGNAVPVLLGRAIAKSIKKHIEDYNAGR